MTHRSFVTLTARVGAIVFACGISTPADGQSAEGRTQEWTPQRLADGQPNIQGMWNNADANHTPLELPDELAGRDSFSQEELRALSKARYDSTINASKTHKEGTVGFYALYWWDWYWSEPVGGDWPALLVEPKSGRMPAQTEEARDTAAYMRAHLHDTYANMEPGDRCISRGVFGMMMPTAYNNGMLILQSPGYVVLHSEMIHNARIILSTLVHMSTGRSLCGKGTLVATGRGTRWSSNPRTSERLTT